MNSLPASDTSCKSVSLEGNDTLIQALFLAIYSDPGAPDSVAAEGPRNEEVGEPQLRFSSEHLRGQLDPREDHLLQEKKGGLYENLVICVNLVLPDGSKEVEKGKSFTLYLSTATSAYYDKYPFAKAVFWYLRFQAKPPMAEEWCQWRVLLVPTGSQKIECKVLLSTYDVGIDNDMIRIEAVADYGNKAKQEK